MILKMSSNHTDNDIDELFTHTYQRGITRTYITAYLKTKYFSEHFIPNRKDSSDLFFSSIKRSTNET